MTKKTFYDQAIQEYQQALQIDAKNESTVKLGISDCFRLLGRFQEALEGYQEVSAEKRYVSRSHHHHRDLNLKKGICFVELGKPSQALKELEFVHFSLLGP